MIYFKKIIKLPGPKDLGLGESNNSMAISLFAKNGEPTWEDYYDKVKKDYPFKYFLAATLPNFFMRKYKYISRYVYEIYYWIKCHLKRSHQYHRLDLTQPKTIKIINQDGSIREIYNDDYYSYGWADVDSRMLYAIFNLLNSYVEKELKIITDDDVKKDPNLAPFKKDQEEILTIYHWWNVERKIQHEENDNLSDKWMYLSKRHRKQAASRAFKEMEAATTAFEDKTDEMIARLMKIRRTLWS
jgi:hypothetical protein